MSEKLKAELNMGKSVNIKKAICAVALSLAAISVHSESFKKPNIIKDVELTELTQQALFEFTSGTKKGYKSAYEKAKIVFSESNDPIATRLLATMYYSGKGIKQDKGTALEYYLIASDQDAEAAYIAGKMLLSGDGVHADIQEGAELMRLAADMGNINAQEEMAKNSLDQSIIESDARLKLMHEKSSLHYSKQCALTENKCRKYLAYIINHGLAGLPKSENAANELIKMIK
jgi:TPR repeat protein